ncbi:uncharacterized protein PADG_04620 [Paracoccidioides brasiliensis Pb18]|uniref:Uncharacterized protein n=1 Tax=Paracoccidioides brasiliensis (strain Pb18) TaxID=502780 RepID=C1GC98_PARBD|nr:uncharacterized protein PADG_04620 [Paracoccidioides brasiliensis Pb18]EEH48541.1 hypothetical protein PADG_04620 [Paracoccidioides brasiliensis Pb18]
MKEGVRVTEESELSSHCALHVRFFHAQHLAGSAFDGRGSFGQFNLRLASANKPFSVLFATSLCPPFRTKVSTLDARQCTGPKCQHGYHLLNQGVLRASSPNQRQNRFGLAKVGYGHLYKTKDDTEVKVPLTKTTATVMVKEDKSFQNAITLSTRAASSTLIKRLNKGENPNVAIAQEFPKWRKVVGRVLVGNFEEYLGDDLSLWNKILDLKEHVWEIDGISSLLSSLHSQLAIPDPIILMLAASFFFVTILRQNSPFGFASPDCFSGAFLGPIAVLSDPMVSMSISFSTFLPVFGISAHEKLSVSIVDQYHCTFSPDSSD